MILLGLVVVPTVAYTQQQLAAGVVNGDTVALEEFAREVGRRQELFGLVGNTDPADVIESTWNDMVRSAVLRQDASRKGIVVSEKQVTDYLLTSPPDFVKRGIVDASGRFDAALLRAMITNPDSLVKSRTGRTDLQRQSDRAKLTSTVTALRHRVHAERLQAALHSRNMESFRVDSAALRVAFERSATYLTADFMRLPCASSPQSVSNDELDDWYTLHSHMYRHPTAQRRLAILHWPLVPSRGDTARVLTGMRAFARELNSAQGTKRDSLLAASASQATLRTVYLHPDSAKTLPLLEAVKGRRNNDVAGPVIHTGDVVVVRIDSLGGKTVKTTEIRLPIEAGPNVVDSVLTTAQQALDAYDSGEDLGSITNRFQRSVVISPWFARGEKMYGSYRLTHMAFATQVGVACDVVDVPDLGVVVAIVADSAEAGPMNYQAAITDLRAGVTRDKQCYARDRMAKAMTGLVSLTPEGLFFVAERLPETVVMHNVTFDSDGYTSDGERDTTLFSILLNGAQPGISGPHLGDLGWYVVNLRQVVRPLEVDYPRFLAERAEELIKEQQDNFIAAYEQSLLAAATIIDWRWMTFRY